jgi:hypothetical protein
MNFIVKSMAWVPVVALRLSFVLLSLALAWSVNAQVELSSRDFESAVSEYVSKVEEFKEIRSTFPDKTIYIGGGGALRILQAVKRHLESNYPLPTNLFDLLSVGQDIDLYTAEDFNEAREVLYHISSEYSYMQESGRSLWDVATLYEENGRGVIDSKDYQRQNTDLASTGMVLIAGVPDDRHPLILSTRVSENGHDFMTVVDKGINSYLNSKSHNSTSLAGQGKNPKVVSALKFLANSVRFDLSIPEDDLQKVKSIVTRFISMKKKARESLDEYYLTARMDKILTNALFQSVDLKKTFEVFQEAGVNELITYCQRYFERGWRYLEVKSVLERAKALSVDLHSSYSSGEPINSKSGLQHLSVVELSRRHGGNSGSVFLDFYSSQYQYALLLSRILIGANADLETRIKVASHFIGSGIGRSDSIVKTLDFQDDHLDCRGDAIVSSVIASVFGIEAYTHSNHSHTGTYWRGAKRKYMEISHYNCSDIDDADIRTHEHSRVWKGDIGSPDYELVKYMSVNPVTVPDSLALNNKFLEQDPDDLMRDFTNLVSLVGLSSSLLSDPSLLKYLDDQDLHKALGVSVKSIKRAVEEIRMPFHGRIALLGILFQKAKTQTKIEDLFELYSRLVMNHHMEIDLEEGQEIGRLFDFETEPENYNKETLVWLRNSNPEVLGRMVLPSLTEEKFEELAVQNELDHIIEYLVENSDDGKPLVKKLSFTSTDMSEAYLNWRSSFVFSLFLKRPYYLTTDLELLELVGDPNKRNLIFLKFLEEASIQPDQLVELIAEVFKAEKSWSDETFVVYVQASKKLSPIKIFEILTTEARNSEFQYASFKLLSVMTRTPEGGFLYHSPALVVLREISGSRDENLKRTFKRWLSASDDEHLKNYLKDKNKETELCESLLVQNGKGE